MVDGEFEPQFWPFDDATAIVTGAIGAAQESIAAAEQVVSSFVEPAIQTIVESPGVQAIISAPDNIQQAFVNAPTEISSFVAPVQQVISSFVEPVQQAFVNAPSVFSAAIAPAQQVFENAPSAVASFVSAPAQQIFANAPMAMAAVLPSPVQAMFSAPAAMSVVARVFENAPAPIAAFAAPAIRVFENAPAFVAAFTAPAEQAIFSAPAAIQQAFVNAPSTIAAFAAPAEQIVFSAPAAVSSFIPTQLKSDANTFAQMGVLLGAGVATAVPGWWDIGANLGNTLADQTYAAQVHVSNFISAGDFNSNAGASLTWTDPVTGKKYDRDPVTLAVIRPASDYGGEARRAILGAITDTTGFKLSDTPFSDYMPADLKKNILGKLTGSLVDMVLQQPGTIFTPAGDVAGGAMILDMVLKPGAVKGGIDFASSFVLPKPSVLPAGALKNEKLGLPSKIQYNYVVEAYTRKDQCVGKVIGTPGCP